MLPESRLVGLLLGEADAAMERALERAGNVARSKITKAAKDQPVYNRINGRPNVRVLSLLNAKDFETIGTSPTKLLEGAWDSFAAKAEGLVQPWIIDKIGANGHRSSNAARSVVDDLCSSLQTLVLDDMGAREYPNGLRVPDMLVVTALEQIGQVSW